MEPRLYRVHESVYGENKNVIIKCGEGFTGKEMSRAADGKEVKRRMTECRMTTSCRERMLPRETIDVPL